MLLFFCQYFEPKSKQKKSSKSVDTSEYSIVKRKQGRASKAANNDIAQTDKLVTRSQYDSFNKSTCVICQEGRVKLAKDKNKGHRKKYVRCKKLDDKSFFIHLNTISKANDVIANDVIYHSLCWARAKK